jgi:hypothetical protein
MFSIFLLCFVALFQQPQTWGSWDHGNADLSQVMDIAIAANKDFYYVREPLHLQITLNNKSDKILSGSFQPNFGGPGLTIYYRRTGGEFVQFTCQRTRAAQAAHIGLIIPTVLKPQASVANKEWITFDTAARQSVLAEPGQYEFQAVYYDWPYINDPQRKIVSPVIAVEVLAAPNNELEVLKQFDNETVGRLFQDDYPIDDEERKKAIDQLAMLMEKYPNSVYIKYIRRGLYRALCWHGTFTGAERQLYDKLVDLKAKVTNDDYVEVLSTDEILQKLKELNMD